MKRLNTEQNLSLITHRNEGKRKSLVLDGDYDYRTLLESRDALSTLDSDDHLSSAPKPELKLPLGGTVRSKSRKKSQKGLNAEEANGLAPEDVKETISNLDKILHNQFEASITEIDRSFGNHRMKKNRKAKKPSIEVEEVDPLTEVKPTEKNEILHNFRSKFGDIEFFSQSSTIFDADYFKNSEFFGIYVLFWLGTAFLMLSSMAHAYFDNSIPFAQLQVISILRKDLFKVGLTDIAMYITSYGAYFIQVLCLKKYIRWKSSGIKLHCLFEFVHLVFWSHFASYQDFPWIAKVFLCLHGFVFLMKMHSYGFYNGYLWNILDELEFSKSFLEKLNGVKPVTLPGKFKEENVRKTLNDSVTFCEFELECQSRAVLTHAAQVHANIDQEALSKKIHFPSNINLYNFFEFSMYPTVVYTLNFTRTKRIRWSYVFEKTAGVFGIIFLMILVAQNSMYPLVVRASAARQLPANERLIAFFFILLDMIPPFLMEYLFTFFLIWDAILNDIAELSRFADRDFYGPWWSCTDWSEFARIWNRPVHKFLLRHVYHSSVSTLELNKYQASLMTFIISSLVHEFVMYVIFNRLRGYLLLLQMSQIPLIMMSRTKYMRDKKVLGNVICWFGFISGPAIICTLYLIF